MFQRYRHIEAEVTAALMGTDTVPYIVERILQEAIGGRLQSYTMEVAFGDVYTITFRYKNSDITHTLTEGMYLLELNDGSLYVTIAEDFEKNYKWTDPTTVATVGVGIVGKAKLTG